MLPCAFLESQHLLPSERLYFCNYVECMLGRFNYVQLFVIQWTVTCQAPLSMGFSRQEYWSVLPFPSPGDLPYLYSTISFFLSMSFKYVSLSYTLTGEGNGTPLQYSCLENPMDGGAWWAAVHGVAKSQARLSDFTLTFHFHALEKEMATHSMFLPGESQGRGSLVGCRLWGSTESDTTEAP